MITDVPHVPLPSTAAKHPIFPGLPHLTGLPQGTMAGTDVSSPIFLMLKGGTIKGSARSPSLLRLSTAVG